MKRKLLSEEQAWLVVAAIFAPRYGLCSATANLRRRGLITRAQEMAMDKRHKKLPRENGSYIWEAAPAILDDNRHLFALRQAALAKRRAK